MKTACNTPKGSENWHIEIIQGSMLEVFAQSWDLFSCPADLEDCGFLAMCNWKSHTKFEREGENKLAQVMFEVYSGVVMESYLSMLSWTDRFPGLFVGLLQRDLDKRKKNMLQVKKQFELL